MGNVMNKVLESMTQNEKIDALIEITKKCQDEHMCFTVDASDIFVDGDSKGAGVGYVVFNERMEGNFKVVGIYGERWTLYRTSTEDHSTDWTDKLKEYKDKINSPN